MMAVKMIMMMMMIMIMWELDCMSNKANDPQARARNVGKSDGCR
ncbi:hypothetical protein AK812_SmicGene47151, partial [Symbiodinium microadriaticum]